MRLSIAAVVATFLAGFAAVTERAAGEETRRFDLRIENGRLVGDLKTVRVRRNDTVEINWSADRRTAIHLHGYHIETVVDAGTPGTMAFRARATGRFPIETHDRAGRHRTLIYLEVHPR